MELGLLKIFLTVAQESSLTLASLKLNTVQSNLSARLKILEEEIGHALFIRTKKGMILTEQGERLKPLAAELIQRAFDIKSELNKRASSGNVVLGVPESFLRTYLKKPLEKWVKDHPESLVRIKTGFSHQISADLENREIDFGVIISRVKPKQFHILKEFKSELVVVTPKFVDKLDRLKLSKLQPMLLGDSCFFGQAVSHLCGQVGLEPRSYSYLHSIESIIHCVSSGIGFSVMPKSLMDNHFLKGQLGIHSFIGKKDFSFFKACLKSRKNSALVEEISKYL